MTPARKLKIFKEENPKVFPLMETFIKPKKFADWADWCLVPFAAAIAAVTEGKPEPIATQELAQGKLKIAQEAAALFAWEKTKGIYRFDLEIYEEVINAPLEKLPSEVLLQLPEWAVFIELYDCEAYGVWAYLEDDMNTHISELRLTFLLEKGDTITYPVMLDSETLEENMNKLLTKLALAPNDTVEQLAHSAHGGANIDLNIIKNSIALVAYICSAEADIILKPTKNQNRKIRGIPSFPKEWAVGERIGAAIRKYKLQYEGESSSTSGSGVRPHVRKAHWHHYWTGEGRKKLVCKWLPPIPVGWRWEDEELPAVVHKIKK